MEEDILENLLTENRTGKPDVSNNNKYIINKEESDVFIEGDKNSFIFKSNTDKSEREVEDVFGNKRINFIFSSEVNLNRKTRTVTRNSLSRQTQNNSYVPFCDSCTETVNNIQEENYRILYGKVGYDFDIIEKSSGVNDITIEDEKMSLSLSLLNEDPENPTIIYPIILNLNSSYIVKKGCKIDPFNIYEEITRNLSTDINEKGLNVSLGKNSCLDSRNRNIEINDFVVKNNKTLEPYDDTAEIQELTTVFKKSEIYRGDIVEFSRDSNGNLVRSFNENSKITGYIKSKESRYLSNNNMFIETFVERKSGINRDTSFLTKEENRNYINSEEMLTFYNSKNKVNNTLDSTKKYFSHGYKTDYNISQGIDSIAYRGLME